MPPRTINHSGHLAVIGHKKGDTFTWSGALKTDEGGGVSLEGWSVRGQVIDPDDNNKVYELEFKWLNQKQGLFHLEIDETDTAQWIGDRLTLDIEFTTNGGSVFSSPTITIAAEEDNTV